MTNLNDHIKQQQEVNRGKAEEAVFPIPLSLLKLPKEDVKRVDEEIYKVIDTLTADTIKKTLAEVTHEWNKAEQKLNGTAQGAVNCIEYFRNFLTQLEDSNN